MRTHRLQHHLQPLARGTPPARRQPPLAHAAHAGPLWRAAPPAYTMSWAGARASAQTPSPDRTHATSRARPHQQPPRRPAGLPRRPRPSPSKSFPLAAYPTGSRSRLRQMAGRLADAPAEQARLEVSNGPGWRAHAIAGLGCAHLPPLRGSLGWSWSSPTRPTRHRRVVGSWRGAQLAREPRLG